MVCNWLIECVALFMARLPGIASKYYSYM
jgi:hypothetical protein